MKMVIKDHSKLLNLQEDENYQLLKSKIEYMPKDAKDSKGILN
jgi:hypothetical protein